MKRASNNRSAPFAKHSRNFGFPKCCWEVVSSLDFGKWCGYRIKQIGAFVWVGGDGNHCCTDNVKGWWPEVGTWGFWSQWNRSRSEIGRIESSLVESMNCVARKSIQRGGKWPSWRKAKDVNWLQSVWVGKEENGSGHTIWLWSESTEILRTVLHYDSDIFHSDSDRFHYDADIFHYDFNFTENIRLFVLFKSCPL
jgi:hypothetical protein